MVIVTCGKLDGEAVLAVVQLYLIALVEGLWQNDVAVILHTSQDLLFTHEELCQHDARQRLLLILAVAAHPVDTIQTTE